MQKSDDFPSGPMGASPTEPAVLIDNYLRKQVTTAEAEELLRRLDASPEFGRRVLDNFDMDVMLNEISQTGNFLDDLERDAEQYLDWAPSKRLGHGRRERRFLPAALIAALLLMAATVLCVRFFMPNGPVAESATKESPGDEALPSVDVVQEPTTTAVAILGRTVDAAWDSEGFIPGRDGTLAPCLLKLRSGVAEIMFFSGATLILEGPVDLSIESSMNVICHRGRLEAVVPQQAIGFRVDTPQVKVVDQGTSFTVDVSKSVSKIHVAQGYVSLVGLPGGDRPVRSGKTVHVDADGRIETLAADENAENLFRENRQRLDALQKDRYEKWKAASGRWDDDESLLVRFDFEELSERENIVQNRSTFFKNSFGGVRIGASPARGRWAEKGALEFRRVSDRVRVDVPGAFDSLTFAAWVRVDSMELRFNSLFLGTGYPLGGVHWQVTNEGFLRVAIRLSGDKKEKDLNFNSSFSLKPQWTGRWIHLATVIDGDRKTVSHFINGEIDGEMSFEFDRPLILGSCDLGNWTPGDYSSTVPVRNFNGCFDEFFLFSRPLSVSEVRWLYNGSESYTTKTKI